MVALSIISSALLLAAAPEINAEAVNIAPVHAAVGRSLHYLEAGADAWRAERKCVTCHRIALDLWVHNEARLHKVAFDEPPLGDMTGWAFEFCATDKNKEEFTGGFLNTMSQMILSQEHAAKDEQVLRAFEVFVSVLARTQREDGSWHEGNQIKIAGAEREADEVDTMWTLLALKALEPQLAAPSEATRAALGKCQERGWAWLQSGSVGARTDWLMLRMLLAQKYDGAKQLPELRQKLLDAQLPDGGWSFVKDTPSHAHVTGECLYALSVVGLDRNDPALTKARDFLLAAQQPDGSWLCASRRQPERTYDITNYWGTAWATIGLLRSIP